MKKIFEIPIYAISRETLKKRVDKDKTIFIKKHQYCPDEKLLIAYDNLLLGKKTWEYNHIIGYLVIAKRDSDIIFLLYKPLKPIKRYFWKTEKKSILINQVLNGYHFSMRQYKSNREIILEINNLIKGIIKNHLSKNEILDMEIYNNLKGSIDFWNL